MDLFSELRECLLENLRAKGYSPNQSDVVPSCNAIMAIIAREKMAAAQEVASSQPAMPAPADLSVNPVSGLVTPKP